MDVEQAMLYANRTASQVRDPQALEVVRTLAAEVRRLQPMERQLQEASEIDTYETCEGPPAPARRWSSSGTWLYPGDRVVVLYAAEAARDWVEAHVQRDVPPRGEGIHAHARRDRNQLR